MNSTTVPACGPAPVGDRDGITWPVLGTCGKMRNKDLFLLVGKGREQAEQRRRAIAVCDRCPVRQACRDFAVSTGQSSGIWGGQDMSCPSAPKRITSAAIDR